MLFISAADSRSLPRKKACFLFQLLTADPCLGKKHAFYFSR
jgi:hypothetical protein